MRNDSIDDPAPRMGARPRPACEFLSPAKQ